jgi:hypothetical protein
MNGLIQPQKRKVFVSFHHDDQWYRDQFDALWGEHFISVSVDDGDIDSDNSDEHIKRLIQKEHIVNSSVVVALYGAQTKNRKHVDWEIYGGLTDKVGGHKGLVVMLLPTFPVPPYDAYGNYDPKVIYPYLHPRTAANLESGYANLYYWPGMYANYRGVTSAPMPDILSTAATKRETHNHLIDNSHPQYALNLA